MKKVLFSLFFICMFLFPVAADFTVDNVVVHAEVAANGKTEVTSSIQLTFDSVQEEVTIPLPEGEATGVSVQSFRYRVRETENGINVVVTTGSGFAGTQTFIISYDLPAFTDDGYSQDLYKLSVLSSRWAKEIGSVSVQLQLPGPYGEVDPEYEILPQLLSGYYGDLDPVDTSLSFTGNLISGSVSDRMAYDSLAVQVSLPNGYFRVRSSSIPMIAITWVCMAMVAVLLLCMLYWHLKLRNRHVSVTARLLSPEGILPYQLPQVLDGYTVDIAALILEWANLGYLSMGYARNRQVVLRKNMDMGSERNRAEQRLFRQIFSGGNRVVATPGRFSSAARQFRAASRKSLSRVAYDRSGGNAVFVQLPCRLLLAVAVGYLFFVMLPEGPAFTVISVVAGIVGFVYSMYLHSALSAWKARRAYSWKSVILMLLSGLIVLSGLMEGAFLETVVGVFALWFSAMATAVGPRRSDRGRDALGQTKGCLRFYRHASWHKLQVYMGHNSRFFQLELPKAVALGCDKVFAARFERLSVPQPEWLPGLKKKARSAKDLQKVVAPMVKKLREAFR